MEKCENCGKELQPLNPSVEDYVEYKFCINIFGWKLMLLKDKIEYGCPQCMAEEEDYKRSDNFKKAVRYAIQEEIEKGRLVVPD